MFSGNWNGSKISISKFKRETPTFVNRVNIKLKRNKKIRLRLYFHFPIISDNRDLLVSLFIFKLIYVVNRKLYVSRARGTIRFENESTWHDSIPRSKLKIELGCASIRRNFWKKKKESSIRRIFTRRPVSGYIYIHVYVRLPRSCWWRRWIDPATWCLWRGPGSPRLPGCHAAAARVRADTKRDEDAAASGDAAADRAAHFAPLLGQAAVRRPQASYRPRCWRYRRPHSRPRRPHPRETIRAGTAAPGTSASAPRGSA